MKNISLVIFLAALYFCKSLPTCGNAAPVPEIKIDTGGLIYFSYDNGSTWKDRSNGLPPDVQAGLGSIAVSGQSLALMTKQHGVYLFDSIQNTWENIAIDEKLSKNNPAAMAFYRNGIYVGTQYGGIFVSNNQGKTWTSLSEGLGSLTIRKFTEIDNTLYAGTNGGLYSFYNSANKWIPEIAEPGLQVNGITALGNEIYIATNRGAYKTTKQQKKWQPVFTGKALHNISSDDHTIYAMTYNELFSSTNKGLTWQSIQRGLPADLYSFNVIKKGNTVFASQWDGVYRKDIPNEPWKPSSQGLPAQYAATNMKIYNDIIVVSCTERKLKAGMTTGK